MHLQRISPRNQANPRSPMQKDQEPVKLKHLAAGLIIYGLEGDDAPNFPNLLTESVETNMPRWLS